MSRQHNTSNDSTFDNYKSLQSNVSTGFTAIPIYTNQNVPLITDRLNNLITNASTGTQSTAWTLSAPNGPTGLTLGNPTVASSLLSDNTQFRTSSTGYLFQLPVRGIFIVTAVVFANQNSDTTIAANKQIRLQLHDENNVLVGNDVVNWSNGTANLTVSVQVDNATPGLRYFLRINHDSTTGNLVGNQMRLTVVLIHGY